MNHPVPESQVYENLERAARALYSVLCHLLTREAAENMGRQDKAVSPTFFNT